MRDLCCTTPSPEKCQKLNQSQNSAAVTASFWLMLRWPAHLVSLLPRHWPPFAASQVTCSVRFARAAAVACFSKRRLANKATYFSLHLDSHDSSLSLGSRVSTGAVTGFASATSPAHLSRLLLLSTIASLPLFDFGVLRTCCCSPSCFVVLLFWPLLTPPFHQTSASDSAMQVARNPEWRPAVL